MPKFIDLTEKRFGRLVVLSLYGRTTGRKRLVWLCQCDCGNISKVHGSNLQSGISSSCGCYKRERDSEANRTHGMSKTIEYTIWRSMHSRCYNKNSSSHKNYGGRGITVCPSWHNFLTFFQDMGKRPSQHHTIERIDNNGIYSPENCQWLLRSQQNNNTRRTIYISHNGVTQKLFDWAREHEINPARIRQRLRYGYSFADSIKPKLPQRIKKYGKHNRLITINGETKCLSQWIKCFGISRATVKTRLKLGWNVITALTTPPRQTASHKHAVRIVLDNYS